MVVPCYGVKVFVVQLLNLPAFYSCGSIAGHFSHVKLTQAIFHPNHMRLLQRTLQKICLGCGLPLVKKKKVPLGHGTCFVICFYCSSYVFPTPNVMLH